MQVRIDNALLDSLTEQAKCSACIDCSFEIYQSFDLFFVINPAVQQSQDLSNALLVFDVGDKVFCGFNIIARCWRRCIHLCRYLIQLFYNDRQEACKQCKVLLSR